MKFILNHRWLRPDEKLATQIRQKILNLKALVRIEAAEVTLERNPSGSPPYSAKVHLVIPGPDLHAEEKDHTPEASIHKVLSKLSRQIRHRKQKLQTRRRQGVEEIRGWNRSNQSLSFQGA